MIGHLNEATSSRYDSLKWRSV